MAHNYSPVYMGMRRFLLNRVVKRECLYGFRLCYCTVAEMLLLVTVQKKKKKKTDCGGRTEPRERAGHNPNFCAYVSVYQKYITYYIKTRLMQYCTQREKHV